MKVQTFWIIIFVCAAILARLIVSCNGAATKVLKINLNEHYNLNSGDVIDDAITQALDSLNNSIEYGSAEFTIEKGEYYLNTQIITKKPFNIIHLDTTNARF